MRDLEFDTTIDGIPCVCRVLVFEPGEPPKGWFEGEPDRFEYEILDRKGYRAPWLEQKITADDDYRLLQECKEYCQ